LLSDEMAIDQYVECGGISRVSYLEINRDSAASVFKNEIAPEYWLNGQPRSVAGDNRLARQFYWLTSSESRPASKYQREQNGSKPSYSQLTLERSPSNRFLGS